MTSQSYEAAGRAGESSSGLHNTRLLCYRKELLDLTCDAHLGRRRLAVHLITVAACHRIQGQRSTRTLGILFKQRPRDWPLTHTRRSATRTQRLVRHSPVTSLHLSCTCQASVTIPSLPPLASPLLLLPDRAPALLPRPSFPYPLRDVDVSAAVSQEGRQCGRPPH